MKYLNIDYWAYYWKCKLSDLDIWWFWFAKGWPFKRRCGQCAGSGKYASEAMARYDKPPYPPCSSCDGTGVVRRRYK